MYLGLFDTTIKLDLFETLNTDYTLYDLTNAIAFVATFFTPTPYPSSGIYKYDHSPFMFNL